MSVSHVPVKPLNQARVIRVPVPKIVARKINWRMLNIRPVVIFHHYNNFSMIIIRSLIFILDISNVNCYSVHTILIQRM